MPKLKIKKANTISMYDWDEFVCKVYKRPYCLQQQDGCMPKQLVGLTVPDECDEDDYHDDVPEIVNSEKMGVKFSTWLKRDPSKKINASEFGNQLWWERTFYPPLQAVANDLYHRGLLKAGEYGINIDW